MARESQATVAIANKREGRISRRKSRRGHRGWPPKVATCREGELPPATDKSVDNEGRVIAIQPRLVHDDGLDQQTGQSDVGVQAPLTPYQAQGLVVEDGACIGKVPADEPDLLQLLRGLNVSIDAPHEVLFTAANTLTSDINEAQQAALPAPLPKRRPPRHRHGRAAVVSVASVLALLGWIGWHVHLTSTLVQQGPVPPKSSNEIFARSGPALAAVVPPGTAKSMAGAERAKEPAWTPTAPLRGVPGQTIPLGIRAPQPDGDTEVAVMIQGVPERARLSAGQRVGGDSWILDAEQIPGVALIVPDEFAPGQVVLDIYFVTSDGRIPKANSIIAIVEATAAPRSPVAVVVNPPKQQRAIAADTPRDVVGAPLQAPEQEPTLEQEEQASALQPETPLMEREPQLMEIVESGLTRVDSATRFVLAHAVRRTEMQPGNSETASLLEGPSARDEALDPTADHLLQPASSGEVPMAGATLAAASHASGPALPERAPPLEAPSADTGEAQTESDAIKSSKPPASTRTARVNTHVNLRARPDNGAAVIAVVPAGGRVEVIRCRTWCEVTFGGKRGWIYRGFIGGVKAAAARTASGASSSWMSRIRSIFTPSTTTSSLSLQ